MPIYDYECSKCKHTFEKLQSYFSPPPKCPKCGDDKAKKMVSIPAKPVIK